MALASHWIKPSRTRRENLQECQCSLDHVLGWFARPLFTDGKYPPCMRERLGSRLPTFTPEESEEIRGAADFFALSHGASLSFNLINDSLKFGQKEDLDLRMLLHWVHAEYDAPPVLVVQSGWWVLISCTCGERSRDDGVSGLCCNMFCTYNRLIYCYFDKRSDRSLCCFLTQVCLG